MGQQGYFGSFDFKYEIQGNIPFNRDKFQHFKFFP